MYTSPDQAESNAKPRAPPGDRSLAARFAAYGLQNSQLRFRSFPKPATATGDPKMRTRGIPSGAIEAQLRRESAGSGSHESGRPKYRSFAMAPPAPAGAGAGPGLGFAMGSPSGVPSAQYRKTTRTFDPFSLRRPVFRGMKMPQAPATLVDRSAAPAGLGSTLGGALGVIRAHAGKDAALTRPAPAALARPAPAAKQPGGDIVVPPIPSAPYELERHSSFFTSTPPGELQKTLEQALLDSGADFEFKSHKCKWKVFAFDGNQSTKVVVKVFQMRPSHGGDMAAAGQGNKARFAVEFQRRKGDAFAFFRWYRALYNSLLGSCGFVLSKGGVAQSDKLQQPFDGRRAADCQLVPSLQQVDLLPLVNMVKTPYDEVRCEAIREIARLSKNQENQRHLASITGFIPTVRDMLKSNNVDVNRCAATAIASMATTCAAQLVKEGVQKALCDFLIKHDRGIYELQSQRESARALGEIHKAKSGMAPTLRDDLFSLETCGHARTVLASLKDGCRCPRLKNVCAKALLVV